jgi:hypothetical protein
MTPRTNFIRKIIYLLIIAVLLLPLSMLSQPSARNAQGDVSPGGTLAKLRTEYKISQANLGEIDPTSVAARLSTLGMSGIAASINWRRADHYKKTENWTEYENTLNEISKLQPNFIDVWKFQAWNLSYNLSVEFDDFNTRYLWVKKGIRFLINGSNYNDTDYRLAWDVGWIINQKIGKSDEQDQFRRLFKRDMREDDRGGDPDFRKDMPFSLDDCEDPRGERDNWLVGGKWYARAEEMIVDERDVRLSPPIFYSSKPMAAIKYATALIKDGIFDRGGEPIRKAWEDAARQWNEFGDRSIGRSVRVRLNDQQVNADRIVELEKRISDFEADEATADQALLRALRTELLDVQNKAEIIQRYRRVSNYDYWKKRCEYEQMPEAIQAHQLAFEGQQAAKRAEFAKALDAYHGCFENWRVVLNHYPELVEQMGTMGDVGDHIEDYKELLEQMEYPLPAPFVLQDVIDAGQGSN